MRQNPPDMYDCDRHIAEIYDQSETYDDDLQLIRRLIGDRQRLRILEPFCGTGRILIPLAQDGHHLVGMERAQGMLARAREKIARLSDDVRQRITLIEADVLQTQWPQGFDLVLLGGNCLYEIATPEDQERIIKSGAESARAGGHFYVDNNHMEGDLDESWQNTDCRQGFPSGKCADGSQVESTIQVIWFDVPKRLIQYKRRTRVTYPNQQIVEREYIQQTHPVSTHEVETWLTDHGLIIEHHYGDRQGNPYTPDSPRAIFWARKP